MAILAFQKPDKVLMNFVRLSPVSVLPLVMLYAVFFSLHWRGMQSTPSILMG